MCSHSPGRPLIAALLFLSLAVADGAGADRFLLLNSCAPRVMGMGGCFTAETDWSAAACYNPAAGAPSGDPAAPLLTLLLNPLPPLFVLEEANAERNLWSRAFPWSLYVSTLYLQFKHLALTLMPAVELTGRADGVRDEPWRTTIGSQETVSYLAAAYRMDEKVSLGISLPIIWNGLSGERDTGLIYGIILRPTWRMQVGLTAIDLPGGVKEIRLAGDRLPDNSLNAGLRYRWKLRWFPGYHRLRMALDFRNVTNEDVGEVSQEMHVGWELNSWRHLQLRCGLYWCESFFNGNPGPITRTLGIGLFDLQALRWYGRLLPHPTTAVDYAVVFHPDRSRTYYLSVKLAL